MPPLTFVSEALRLLQRLGKLDKNCQISAKFSNPSSFFRISYPIPIELIFTQLFVIKQKNLNFVNTRCVAGMNIALDIACKLRIKREYQGLCRKLTL